MTNDKIVQLSPDKIKYSTMEEALEAIQNGGFVIVADDEGRENEGDLICSAEKITPQMVNFMMKEARGMICVSMTSERAEKLALNQMVDQNSDPNQTAFTVSVDAGPEFGVTTGISASDRCATIQRLATENATPHDFRRPGHMFPIQAKKGGVLRRIGHTEAATDLTRLAGLQSVGVICEIVNDDGTMARRDDLVAFGTKHNLPFITIAQIVKYRMEHERTVIRKVIKEIETKFGTFTAVGYQDTLDNCEHLALVKGTVESLSVEVPYVRVQHENILTDVLGRTTEEMPHEMAQAMAYIQDKEHGVVVYLRHRDDSVHGLLGSLKAYNNAPLPHQAYDASKADLREYGVGAQILADLGVNRFRMLSQSTKKIVALRGYGLKVIETIPLSTDNFDFAEPPKVDLPSTNAAPVPVAETIIETVEMKPTVIKTPLTPPTEVEVSAPVVEQPAAVAEPLVAPVAAPVVAAAPQAQNENNKEKISVLAEETGLRAEPREPRFATMKMGGQIMSGQALFESQ